jgi:hypothetical protein
MLALRSAKYRNQPDMVLPRDLGRVADPDLLLSAHADLDL